ELEEALEDEDTYRDIDFESDVNPDGQIVWWFRGDEAIDVHHPEEQLEKAKGTEDTEGKDSGAKTLSRDRFDKLGEDVAKTLRDMGVQRIEITEDGDKKHVKLKLSEERKIETGHDVVTAVALDDEVELDFSVGEDGSLHVSNVEGIAGEIAGLPVGPDINSV